MSASSLSHCRATRNTVARVRCWTTGGIARILGAVLAPHETSSSTWHYHSTQKCSFHHGIGGFLEASALRSERGRAVKKIYSSLCDQSTRYRCRGKSSLDVSQLEVYRSSHRCSVKKDGACRLKAARGTFGSEAPEALVRDLLEYFQGDFDNYDQVVEDRKAGMLAGTGGGHEHIHCSLRHLDSTQVPRQILEDGRGDNGRDGTKLGNTSGRSRTNPMAVVAAKYYFNGDARVVFRYRLYSFHACQSTRRGKRGDVEMRLWRLTPSVEQRLRANDYDLTDFEWYSDGSGRLDDSSNDKKLPLSEVDVAERMWGCEIYWSRSDCPDENRSWRRTDSKGIVEGWRDSVEIRGGFVGLMGEDDSGTWITSQTVEGLEILVKDDIKLWRDRLWVNDRGFDRKGDFAYGNQRGVPYKMSRVSVPGPLEWTLGREWRTEELYVEKMSAIGVTPRQSFGPPVSATPKQRS